MPMRYADTRNTTAMPADSDSDDLVVVLQYLRVLWNHKWILLLSGTLGCLIALAIVLRTVPLYEAATTIEIQNVQEPFGPSLVAADPALATQIQLLSSGTMKERVSKKLTTQNDVPIPPVLEPLPSLRKLLGMPQPIRSVSWSSAVGRAAGSLNVTISKDSRVLVIQTQSPNPQAAADFVNTLAQTYIDRTQEERWESYENTSQWLNRAQGELKEKLEESERRLADFARSKGLLFLGQTQNMSEDKVRQLQGSLITAATDRMTKQSIYESSLSSPTESLPAVLDSGPMAGYQSKITELRREMAELSTTLTPAHYRVQRIQAQINELEAARDKERTNVLSRIRIEYEAALKRENQLKTEFEKQSGLLAHQADDLIEYNILLREVESNKKLYEVTLQNGKEASLASAMRTSSARVVDRAHVVRVPFSPNVDINLIVGIIGGLICGAVFIVLRSRSDLRIQIPGVLGSHLNLRELGVIPAAKADPSIRALPAFLKSIGPGSAMKDRKTMLSHGDKSSQDCVELVTWSRKPSVIAEAFRATMTSIMFAGENGERPRVLVLTSPSPQEGKSTVICNLAIALSEINHRVLLIDADMRLPRLHAVFDLPNTFGLSDVLQERTPIEDYVDESLVRKTAIPDLYVLPAGPARTNLSRLLYSSRMKELIRRFRNSFDTILIDSPPVLSVPDARVLARLSDAVILVVRAHKTQQEAAFAAVRCFEEDGRRILGTILNDWNPDAANAGYYGAYGSYGGYGVYSAPYK